MMTKEEFAKDKSFLVVSRVYERKHDNALFHNVNEQIHRIDKEGLRRIIEKCILAGIEWIENRIAYQ